MNFQPCKMDYLIAILFVWNHRALKLTFLMVENGKTRANNYWDRCFEMKIDRPPHYQQHDLLNKFPLYLKILKKDKKINFSRNQMTARAIMPWLSSIDGAWPNATSRHYGASLVRNFWGIEIDSFQSIERNDTIEIIKLIKKC